MCALFLTGGSLSFSEVLGLFTVISGEELMLCSQIWNKGKKETRRQHRPLSPVLYCGISAAVRVPKSARERMERYGKECARLHISPIVC